MTTSAAILDRARRENVGTRFVHQGRLPGVGLDCIGNVVVPGQREGLAIEDYTRYGRRPNPRVLLRYFLLSFDPLGWEGERTPAALLDAGPLGLHPDARPGDVLLFWLLRPRLPQHVGFLTEMPDGRPGILHAHDELPELGGRRMDRVKEHGLGGYWLDHVASTWRYRGLEG